MAALVALLAVLVAAPRDAWGLWNATASLSTEASTATVDPARELRCQTQSLIGLLPSARLTWRPPDSGPPDQYQVLISDGTHTDVLTTIDGAAEPTTDITVGLITGGMIGWLTTLLTRGGQAAVTVQAVHHSGWVSAGTEPVQVRLALTGVRCAS